MIYDLIIIGAGPAGITAAVYASRKKMSFLIISEDIGGQATWSGDIENYTGYQFITGPELSAKFQEHMDHFDIQAHTPERVSALTVEKDTMTVTTDTRSYRAWTVLIATGKRPRMLNVPGEKEYKNKGVTYCATCDGPLFRGKNVAVIGGGNSALDAALQLVRFCPKVHIVNNTASFTGDAVMIEKLRGSSSVAIWQDAVVTAIEGDSFVRRVTVRQKGVQHTLQVEGVFVEVGLIPNSEWVQGVVKNEAGEIVIDGYNRTSVPGVFAAGDVTTVPEKQIIIACGEGSKACLSAFRYLSTHTF